MNRKSHWLLIMAFVLAVLPVWSVPAAALDNAHPVEQLVGERLDYDISFLWFDRLAEGTISMERGEQPGTYLVVMEARTLGLAAFFTRHRVERYQTLMEIGPDGLLRPLRYSSHTFKGTGDQQREKRISYEFDFNQRQAHYLRIKDQRVRTDEQVLLPGDGPVFDILSAFVNLRLGVYGSFDREIRIPTLYKTKVEDLVIAPPTRLSSGDKKFLERGGALCRVLVDPSVFKTNGEELFLSFDRQARLVRGIIKDVIGLGDVRGVLRNEAALAQGGH